jgi:phage shock protein C
MEPRRFARSKNLFICGVCAGIAEYLGINATLTRVLWVVLTITTWFWAGVIAYIVLSFVMPPAQGAPAMAWQNLQGRNVMMVLALALIFIGVWIIAQEFLHIDLNKYLFPIGLIVGGGLLMAFAFGKKGKQ